MAIEWVTMFFINWLYLNEKGLLLRLRKALETRACPQDFYKSIS